MSEDHTPQIDYDILSGQFYNAGLRLLRKQAVQYERNWAHVFGGCYTSRQDDADAWDAALAAGADGRRRAEFHTAEARADNGPPARQPKRPAPTIADALAILDAMAERADESNPVVAHELRRAARRVRGLG